ncbi:hypothetical protein NMQ03_05290 [Arthrobacter sp. DNA4]|uniref:hypothetical protein n=1 Tax=Arthrobacter sp. DNA4 TaxID=2963432 RepID=UPI0020CD54E7|nr:hypothetical protein [Arthrobacter sp. DNA4]UTT70553.1 hypothetical protein NMQ03_05290 [Arthrobacter sp. DNA4]
MVISDEKEDELRAAGEALSSLAAQLRNSGADVPTVAYSQFAQITDLLRALVEHAGNIGSTIDQRVLLAAMSADYLPTSLRTYLALPAVNRASDSPETRLLLEQLAVLHSTASTLEGEIHNGSSTELAIHGRFLQDKFDLGSLLLEDD